MKLTMDSVKELEESLQNNMEILQKNFKKAQDRLQKELKADQSKVKERIQSKKQHINMVHIVKLYEYVVFITYSKTILMIEIISVKYF